MRQARKVLLYILQSAHEDAIGVWLDEGAVVEVPANPLVDVLDRRVHEVKGELAFLALSRGCRGAGGEGLGDFIRILKLQYRSLVFFCIRMPRPNLTKQPSRCKALGGDTRTHLLEVFFGPAGRVGHDDSPRIVVRTAEALHRIPHPHNVPRILPVVDAGPPHVCFSEGHALFVEPTANKGAAAFPHMNKQEVDGLRLAHDDSTQKVHCGYEP
eukprot:scaffold21146_cov112-Isochrysis_galbana.AAC.1